MIKNQVEELKSVATYKNNFTDIDQLRNNLTNITAQGTVLSAQTQDMLSLMEHEINDLPVHGTMRDREGSIDQSTMNILQNALARVTKNGKIMPRKQRRSTPYLPKNDQAVRPDPGLADFQ